MPERQDGTFGQSAVQSPAGSDSELPKTSTVLNFLGAGPFFTFPYNF